MRLADQFKPDTTNYRSEQSHIDAALELVIDLAEQGMTDRYENPTRYRREAAALKLVRETFNRGGG